MKLYFSPVQENCTPAAKNRSLTGKHWSALYLGSSRCARLLPLRLCRPCRSSHSLHSPSLRTDIFAREAKMEARGVEPLSSSLSTQTSTCLSGEIFEKPTLHQHTADFRASANFLHRPARSLRRPISLLSTFGAVAGVQLQTSRSIKPRERDLGDLRLFVLARFLTRPTNHPRHAACASKLQVEASTPPKI